MKLAPTVSILLTTALSCTTRLTMHTMVASHQRRKVNSPDGHWTHSLTVRCWWVAVWWCSLFDSSLILPVPQLFACYQSTAIKPVLLFGDICCEFCISFLKKMQSCLWQMVVLAFSFNTSESLWMFGGLIGGSYFLTCGCVWLPYSGTIFAYWLAIFLATQWVWQFLL